MNTILSWYFADVIPSRVLLEQALQSPMLEALASKHGKWLRWAQLPKTWEDDTVVPLQGKQDAYVHVTLIKKWDICAPAAILAAIGKDGLQVT